MKSILCYDVFQLKVEHLNHGNVTAISDSSVNGELDTAKAWFPGYFPSNQKNYHKKRPRFNGTVQNRNWIR